MNSELKYSQEGLCSSDESCLASSEAVMNSLNFSFAMSSLSPPLLLSTFPIQLKFPTHLTTGLHAGRL